MRTALNIFFYTLLLALLGALAIAFAFHIFDINDIISCILTAYQDLQWRLITGATGFVLILVSLSTVQALTGKLQRERTIAFSNPNGQVTITLSAVEDLIKRLSQQMEEIKDARADVKATKKGIDIRMRVVLRCETSIPDFTGRLQSLISEKIQEVFGIDEPINVKIHVAKIITLEEKTKKKQEKTKQEEIALPPYQSINL